MPGNRILVTGQMAADATYIELELPESEAKIPAKVVRHRLRGQPRTTRPRRR